MKALSLIEGIVFMILGAVILIAGIVEAASFEVLLVGGLFVVAGILHTIINGKELKEEKKE